MLRKHNVGSKYFVEGLTLCDVPWCVRDLKVRIASKPFFLFLVFSEEWEIMKGEGLLFVSANK